MQKDWDAYFIKMARLVSEKSKDRATKVGCVIVGPNNEVRSTGFNGFPRNVNDNNEKRHERPAKYMWTEHAERNGIFNAARCGIQLDNCKIYVDWYPCTDCARAIIQSGIKEIIIDGQNYEEKLKYWNERWKESIDCSIEMLHEAGVDVRVFKGE